MATSVPLEIASTIQTASLQRDPSLHHDINPSTTASQREPFEAHPLRTASAHDDDEIPLSVLRPTPRRPPRVHHPHLPVLPDLRFEQSYLKSVERCVSVRDVAYVTVRDQVLLPLLQGTLWTLLLSGWRHWNRASALAGRGLGTRVRRWWWRVNDWSTPTTVEKP